MLCFFAGSRHQQNLVNQLDAKTAKVGKLVTKDFEANTGGRFHVETTNADLAYYMKLKEADKYDDFEEGDIVGFYEDRSRRIFKVFVIINEINKIFRFSRFHFTVD